MNDDQANDSGASVEKNFTIWQSIAWHLSSRRSRMALGALLTIFILRCQWVQNFFGVDPKNAASFANDIIIVIGIFITAMTGEKILTNGNGTTVEQPKINLETIKEDVLGAVKDEVIKDLGDDGKLDVQKLKKSIIDSVSKRVEKRLSGRIDQLQEDTDATLKKLEGAL